VLKSRVPLPVRLYFAAEMKEPPGEKTSTTYFVPDGVMTSFPRMAWEICPLEFACAVTTSWAMRKEPLTQGGVFP
jgi:hypothetical protein